MITTTISWIDDFRGGISEEVINRVNENFNKLLEQVDPKDIVELTIQMREYEEEVKDEMGEYE
jgi:tripartite-type tricarboxylate transporter receptor subunit TctC